MAETETKDAPRGIKERIDFNKDFALDWHDADEATDGYQLKWIGKNYARLQAGSAPTTLVFPDEERNKKAENAQSGNLFFTGDNIEVLKHLQAAYNKKVDMIYIDPPYNTGKEFVYSDKFDFSDEQLENMLGMTRDEIKRLHTINGRSSHSAWLTFMYPRLRLAKTLLKDTGVIFISIDDNEQANLKLLCDEVFGEGNFVNCFGWVNNLKGRQISKSGAAKTYEYILCYAKNINNIDEFLLDYKYLKEIMPDSYKGFEYELKKDERGTYYCTNELYNTNSDFNEETRPNLVFDIYYNLETKEFFTEVVSNDNVHPNCIKITPHENSDGVHKYHAYRWSREKIRDENYNLEIIKVDDDYKIYTKRRDELTTVKDLITNINTTNGKSDLKKLKLHKYFSFPKPVALIKTLIKMVSNNCQLSTDNCFTILDFFAGSGTTAHAVMQLNAEDGGNRHFILCQLDEDTAKGSEAEKAGYSTIDEICMERIKRVGAAFKHYTVKPLSDGTFDSLEAFDPTKNEMFSSGILNQMGGEDAVLSTYLMSDGVELTSEIKTIDIAGYKARLAGNRLYIIKEGWDTEQTASLLNMVGKLALDINSIVVFGYSMTFNGMKELELGVKQSLCDKKNLVIEKRW